MTKQQRVFTVAYWAGFIGTLAFAGWYAWFSWQGYKEDGQYRLAVESGMVAKALQNSLDGKASALRFLGRQLQRVDGLLHHPRLCRSILADYHAVSPDIASADLVALNGQVIASTAVPSGQPLPDLRDDPALWPGLQQAVHYHGMLVYRPVAGPLVGHRGIGLIYTVFSPGGKPRFFLYTPMRFRRTESFLGHLQLHEGVAAGLVQGNPGGLSASPPQPGSLLRILRAHPALRHGSYEGFVPESHDYRFGAFTRLHHYPLTAFVSVPRDQWLAAWWRRHIQFPLLFLTLALGFSFFSYRRILSLDRRREEQHQDFNRTLTRQVNHDSLTGVLNRHGLQLVLDQAIARADRQERLLAVCFLDLDAFKPVNDNYGHAAGDRLLKEMAGRLQAAVRRTDSVARPGGDEFVLLLENLRHMDELDQILARLQRVIAQPFLIDGRTVRIRASLGLSIHPFDEGDADLLLRHADQAMYAAKARPRRGDGGWAQIYRPGLATINMGDEILRQDFMQALADGSVTLRYQPMVSLATGRVEGLEALVRWHREDREDSPDRFLPALGVPERQALGHFVLQTGMRQLEQWREDGLDLFLSVNVTPEELDHPAFADAVFGILKSHPDISPEALVLEVLEIGEILEQDVALGHLHRFRSAGVRIALDDVGSAYASLLRLKNLPIDEIKIDQGFIRELPNKPQDLMFVESLVTLGLGMGVIITVEGVESEAHIALLREMEVNYLQGYAIARPLETETVADFVRTFVLGQGDTDTPLLALYRHLGWVHAAEQAALNPDLCGNTELSSCPVMAWLHAHMPDLPGIDVLLAEHETVHALGQEILRIRESGTREDLHRLLNQLRIHSHIFQEELGEAVTTMQNMEAARARSSSAENRDNRS